MTPAPKKILQTAFFLAFLFITLRLSTLNSYAADPMGLSAIPPRLEATIKPDGVITEIIKVRNEATVTRTITTNVMDFIVTDNKGTPVPLQSNANELNDRWAASSWITVSPSSTQVKPGETKSLVLTITPPKDALPGGHYAMVIHTPQNGITVSGTGASVETQVGTLVYITIPGDIKEDAQVTRFTAPKFQEFGPIDFQSTIKNLSDIHIAPNGSIIVKNLLGGQTAILPLDKTNIFPYTSRNFQNKLNRKFLFGRYTANLNAQYGSNDKIISATLVFWVIPWRLLILIFAAIAIIAALIIISRNKPNNPPDEAKVDELEKEIEDLKNKYKDKS